MNDVLPLAERMLREHGEFYPYGGFMKANGEIVHVGVDDEESEYPKSADLLYVLRDSFSAKGRLGECVATAIVFDVRVQAPGASVKTDAIEIYLDHQDGYSAEVFLPYEIGPNRSVKYGRMFAQEGKHEIFESA